MWIAFFIDSVDVPERLVDLGVLHAWQTEDREAIIRAIKELIENGVVAVARNA